MRTFQTPYPSGSRPGNGQPTAPAPPPPLPVIDQPVFPALDETRLWPVGRRRPTRRRTLWRVRLILWARQKRLGLWVGFLIGSVALAYALMIFADASRGYAPSYYEPKDTERWRWMQQLSR